VVDGKQVLKEERLLKNAIGRIRDVRMGPDGFLYLLNDDSDAALYRLEPAG
jgi:glucose/arabinose dehydrogenase